MFNRNIWRMHLFPHNKIQESNEEQEGSEFPFCYREKIIGINVKVGENPEDEIDYLWLVKKRYGDPSNELLLAKLICEDMQVDDLVWVRYGKNAGNLQYYLCRILDDWKYCDSLEYRNAGMFSTRRCTFDKINASHFIEDDAEIFDSITEKFMNGRAIQKITDSAEANLTRDYWEKYIKYRK